MQFDNPGKTPAVIFIVDDDPAVRDALGVVFRMEGYEVVGFESGDDFLAAARREPPGCVILDIHMPGRSGMEILRDIDAEHYPSPIFIISGRGDIPTAVSAIKLGAFDFIEKPFDADTVVARVGEAMRKQSLNAGGRNEPQCFDKLTPRERDVLRQITDGASNKEAGRNLGISPRTIEVHRARIMEKLGARNAADLVRIVMSGG